MKKHIALGLVASTLFLAGCCTARHTAVWEYRTTKDIVGVNQLASQGWKLVSFTKDETAQTANNTFVMERKKR
jgi:hypothetical protein